jgi:hypothetical protein
MKKMSLQTSTNQSILQRVSKKGLGWAFTHHDFPIKVILA